MLTRALLTANPDHHRGAQPVGVPVLGVAICFGAVQGDFDTNQDGVQQSVVGHRVVSGTSGRGAGTWGTGSTVSPQAKRDVSCDDGLFWRAFTLDFIPAPQSVLNTTIIWRFYGYRRHPNFLSTTAAELGIKAAAAIAFWITSRC